MEPEVPLIGIISRLVDQKGFDLFETIAGDLFGGRLKIVVLGSGQPSYEELMRDAAGEVSRPSSRSPSSSTTRWPT